MKMLRSTLVGLVLLLSTAGAARAEVLAIIVHAERNVQPPVEEIARIYLKQQRFWSDGERIVPVNRESGNTSRQVFAEVVLGATARELVVYWNRQYFRGVLPPATLASDEAVKRFVAAEQRAIGYIPLRMVDDSVRVVFRIDDDRISDWWRTLLELAVR